MRVSKEELFELLVEGVEDFAIILLGPEGHVASWNAGAQRLLQYSEAEIVGQYFDRFFTPEDRGAGRPEHELREATEAGRAHDENWLVRKDGTRFFASGVTTALRGGERRGFSKIFRDLTERRKLEEEKLRQAEQLADANRRKTEFLAMLSHELRNPLAPMVNALHLIRQEPSDNPVLQRARVMLERQVRHLTRLIDDLLDVTRITQGKIDLRLEHLEVSVILHRAVETVMPLIEERRHGLSVRLPDHPIWLSGDPVRLEQVVTNLLSNAARYTDPGGRIWVTAAQRQGRAIVRVRDSGIGIPPEAQSRIFELFSQVGPPGHRGQGGLGVGLTLVRRLVQMHGGDVSVVSAGTGRGSEFVVELPTIEAPAIAGQTSPEHQEAPERVFRVLIVDDNIDMADSLDMLLKLRGYDTRTAHEAEGALATVREFTPHVVLLDLGLPGASGLEVAARIRAGGALPQPVLVAMTGYGQEEDRRRTHDAGFDHHLVKPISPEALEGLLQVLAADLTSSR